MPLPRRGQGPVPLSGYGLYNIFYNMKTVAVTLDADTLAALERLTSEPGGRSRSAVVREAVLALSERKLRMEREDRERQILHTHRKKLGRQAKALIREQTGS
jgi:metal-responsive CopG/Arc/MetJ family transcriptional regulator